MSSRCKFCGYRFKSDDEAICPECLTAREVDISCNTFAPEEHTHRRYDDSLFKGDELFSKNDTFKEEENEFLKEEREEESETNAARFEKMEQKQRSFQNRNTNMGRTFTNAGFQPNALIPIQTLLRTVTGMWCSTAAEDLMALTDPPLR